MLALFLFTSQVAVSKKGLRLYWVNVVTWDQVQRVAPTKVLGLRYLKVYRKGHWLPWWFPLNFADEAGFRRAVLEYAPEENPFRRFFELSC